MLELNELVDKISTIQNQLTATESDSPEREKLHQYLEKIQYAYGRYLDDMLFEVYDEFCEDNQMQAIEKYLTPEGVPVDADDFPGVRYFLKLKANPLRFELVNKEIGNQKVIWRAA